MFHIYEGFHLVETYHKMRLEYSDGMVRYSEPDSYPAARDCHLCLCHIDVDSRSGQFMGHIDCHYGLDVAILY